MLYGKIKLKLNQTNHIQTHWLQDIEETKDIEKWKLPQGLANLKKIVDAKLEIKAKTLAC